MQILAVSDKIAETLYSTPANLQGVRLEAIISCGDLPPDYLDFLVSTANVPLYYVRGNHQNYVVSGNSELKKSVIHGINLHLTSIEFGRYLIAGVEGWLQYNSGSYQYTQFEMWLHVIRLLPSMVRNRLRRGRWLDVFVTHAPPWGINDQSDPAHQGIKAFRWFISTFKPKYHFHGHVHLYKPGIPARQQFNETLVVNTYGHHIIEIK